MEIFKISLGIIILLNIMPIVMGILCKKYLNSFKKGYEEGWIFQTLAILVMFFMFLGMYWIVG